MQLKEDERRAMAMVIAMEEVKLTELTVTPIAQERNTLPTTES